MVTLSRAQRRELDLVSQGLAIGCISLGVQAVSSDRARIAAALGYAWGRWPHAHKFPALTRGTLRLPEILSREMVRQNRRSRSREREVWRLSADGLWLAPVEVVVVPMQRSQGDARRTLHWEGLAAGFLRQLGSEAVDGDVVAVPLD